MVENWNMYDRELLEPRNITLCSGEFWTKMRILKVNISVLLFQSLRLSSYNEIVQIVSLLLFCLEKFDNIESRENRVSLKRSKNQFIIPQKIIKWHQLSSFHFVPWCSLPICSIYRHQRQKSPLWYYYFCWGGCCIRLLNF